MATRGSLTIGKLFIAAMFVMAAVLMAGDSSTTWAPGGAYAASSSSSLPTGCATGGSSTTPEAGFVAEDFDLTSVSVNGSGHLILDTGATSLDPSSIVIPFEQDVYANFILEGAGYVSHFGWFLLEDAENHYTAGGHVAGDPITGPVAWNDLVNSGVTIHYLFRSIKDDGSGCCDGGNGVLDNYYDDSGTLLGTSSGVTEANLTSWGFSPNNDGTVDTRDMRKYIGKFAANTELVFFLLPNGSTSTPWYSKNGWSGDNWSNSSMIQTLNLANSAPEQGGPAATTDTSTDPDTNTQGWIPAVARTRLSTYYNVTLSGTVTKTYTNGQKYNHFIVGAPPTDPFKWILGMEDLSGGGDHDFNDLVILIERQTGGVAQLEGVKALTPTNSAAYITNVNFKVHDKMPTCPASSAGTASKIKYYLSIDGMTKSGSTTSGSTAMTISDSNGISKDWSVTGAGIPSGTTVASVSGSSVTLSQAATSSNPATVVSTTGTVTEGSVDMYVTSDTGIHNGYAVSGANVASGTTVSSSSGGIITLSSPATGSTTTYSTQGNVSSGSVSLSVLDATNVSIGQWVNGTGIPAGTTVSNVVDQTVTLSQTATSSSTTSASATGTATSGSATLPVTSASGITTGMEVSGLGIPSGTTVLDIAGNNITLSQPATSSTPTVTTTGLITRIGASLSYITYLSSTAGISTGMSVSGTGIPAGATVQEINGNTIMLSTPATSTTSGIVGYSGTSPYPPTISGTIAFNGSTTLTVSSSGGIAVGNYVWGPGVPNGTTVAGIAGGNITLNPPPSTSTTKVNAAFGLGCLWSSKNITGCSASTANVVQNMTVSRTSSSPYITNYPLVVSVPSSSTVSVDRTINSSRTGTTRTVTFTGYYLFGSAPTTLTFTGTSSYTFSTPWPSYTFTIPDTYTFSPASTVEYYTFSPSSTGRSWVEITNWPTVKTPDKNGSTVDDWTYGKPPYTGETYREGAINFSELGISGNQLVWKAEMISPDDACQPEVISVDISYDAAVNQQFSRSAPSALGNILYNGSYETPASSWSDTELRGELTSCRLYDPTNPTSGYDLANTWYSGDGCTQVRDATTGTVTTQARGAGTKLTASTSPDNRNILYPNMTLTQVTDEVVTAGDGVSKTFTATLAHGKVLYSSVSISDGAETFTDSHTNTLTGSLSGTGTINRYTGDITLDFKNAPAAGSQIRATYKYYTTTSAMYQLNTANITYDKLAIDNTSYTDGTGLHYTYDFNGDGLFSESDADWLVQWTRGWKNGTTATTKRDWLMGAIDHSAPAIIGAAGIPAWYYGSDVTDADKDGYDEYRCTNRTRKTLTLIGARDGMLHAFYSGEYRPYYYDESQITSCTTDLDTFRNATNPNTTSVVRGGTTYKYPYYTTPTGVQILINRGYYDWKVRSGSSLTDGTEPNYGDGSETYAVIPVDQLTKLKNNKLKLEDRAFVDASPSVAHIQFADSTWHTVMVSAEGNGGDHLFALDITNADDPQFLWDFGDPDLYRSRSSPSVGAIGRIYTSTVPKWVAFFVSGVNEDSTANPSIYMLDVETGEVLQRIELDSAGIPGLGGTPSGQPALIDSDGNGYADRMYIGTDKGYMYKITLPDNPVSGSGSVSVCTFFNAGQPIYASPAAAIRNTKSDAGALEYKIDVLFGTSDSPFYEDYVPGTTYYFYSVRDSDEKGSCGAGTQRWSMALPAGHRVFASAFASANTVYFGTTTADTEDPCSAAVSDASGSNASGNIYAVDIESGSTSFSATNVGNITTTPVVDDEHLYIKTGNGSLQGRGGNTFQNQVKQGGLGDVVFNPTWREVLQ